MKRRPPPLWLLCDLVAWARVLLSGWSLIHAWREARTRMAGMSPRRLAPGDLARLSLLLAEAEADLAWATARQVRRLCGLPPEEAVRVLASPPRSQWALIVRFRAQMRRAIACADAPERMARRAMRRLAQSPAQPAAECARPDPRASIFFDRDSRRRAAQPRAPPARLIPSNPV